MHQGTIIFFEFRNPTKLLLRAMSSMIVMDTQLFIKHLCYSKILALQDLKYYIAYLTYESFK